MKPLKPGLSHDANMQVEERHTVPEVCVDWPGFRDMPPVLATAMMIGFMEQTCIEALRPFLSGCQHTVGTKVDVSHTAPTPIGMKVTARVELQAVEGRKLTFSVSAHDQQGVIGEGLHERVIIDQQAFMSRVEQRKKSIHTSI